MARIRLIEKRDTAREEKEKWGFLFVWKRKFQRESDFGTKETKIHEATCEVRPSSGLKNEYADVFRRKYKMRDATFSLRLGIVRNGSTAM